MAMINVYHCGSHYHGLIGGAETFQQSRTALGIRVARKQSSVPDVVGGQSEEVTTDFRTTSLREELSTSELLLASSPVWTSNGERLRRRKKFLVPDQQSQEPS